MRVHDGVNAQLQGKGLMRVEANPDLYVATHVTTRRVPELIANGFGPWWGYGGGAATVQTFKSSKNTAKLDKALTKMFERYPPGITSANN